MASNATNFSRLEDANEDLYLSMQELKDERTIMYASQFRAVVRVLGSIAVTLAMMFDHMQNKEDQDALRHRT